MKLANVSYKNQILELSVNKGNDKIAESLYAIDTSAEGYQDEDSPSANEPVCTFDDLLRELNDVKSLVSERGTERHLIGRLLDNDCYIIPNEVVLVDESTTTVSAWSREVMETLSHAGAVMKKVRSSLDLTDTVSRSLTYSTRSMLYLLRMMN